MLQMFQAPACAWEARQRIGTHPQTFLALPHSWETSSIAAVSLIHNRFSQHSNPCNWIVRVGPSHAYGPTCTLPPPSHKPSSPEQVDQPVGPRHLCRRTLATCMIQAAPVLRCKLLSAPHRVAAERIASAGSVAQALLPSTSSMPSVLLHCHPDSCAGLLFMLPDVECLLFCSDAQHGLQVCGNCLYSLSLPLLCLMLAADTHCLREALSQTAQSLLRQ